MSTKEKTLRDEIALSVLSGMHVNALGVKNFGDVKGDEFLDLLATTAYRTADAMLRARDKHASVVDQVVVAGEALRDVFLAGQRDHDSSAVHAFDDAVRQLRAS